MTTSKLDTTLATLHKAGYTAHRTTSEINCKVAGRSVYITASAKGDTMRLNLMGKGQYAPLCANG